MEHKKQEKESKPEIQDNFNYVIRIANTDIDGKKSIIRALRKVKGINFMFSNAICSMTNIDKNKKAGDLTDGEVNKINDFLKSSELPGWILNRRKDPESGEDKHLLASDVRFEKDNEIKTLKKIKCYRGVRHMFRLPVRGQKTKSNFRRNKGKVTGVQKSKVKSKKG